MALNTKNSFNEKIVSNILNNIKCNRTKLRILSIYKFSNDSYQNLNFFKKFFNFYSLDIYNKINYIKIFNSTNYVLLNIIYNNKNYNNKIVEFIIDNAINLLDKDTFFYLLSKINSKQLQYDFEIFKILNYVGLYKINSRDIKKLEIIFSKIKLNKMLFNIIFKKDSLKLHKNKILSLTGYEANFFCKSTYFLL